jgi:hypothetical protein
MKAVFLILWSLALVIFAPVALLGVVMERSPFTSFLLLFVVFYAFCFFKLISVSYPTSGIPDSPRKAYWISWVVLPLAGLYAWNCFSDLLSGSYQPTTGGGRHRSAVLANYLAETVGPWLPASIGLVCSVIVMIACIAAIIRYAKS